MRGNLLMGGKEMFIAFKQQRVNLVSLHFLVHFQKNGGRGKCTALTYLRNASSFLGFDDLNNIQNSSLINFA